MELYDVMRTAFSAREFTDEPVTDELLGKILENARFAPSGGNRQGWHVIVVRDQATKDGISKLTYAPARRYAAQIAAGESPWNAWTPTKLSDEQIAATPVSPTLSEPVRRAPVVLVVCVDLRVVASLDYELDRVGIVSGASVYPLAWNILLAARNEGMGGTLTTMPIAEEPKLRELLHMPDYAAVCAVMPMGWPSRRITRLRRKAVPEFVTNEHWDGAPFDNGSAGTR
jgi:nitroreductase